MGKSTDPSFPWDQIKAGSMRSLCRDLGLKQSHTNRSTMIDFLESVWRVGLPKALDNASTATHTSTSLSTPRTSRKRARDTPTTTTVTTASSILNGDEPSSSKRHRHGPDVASDYNTRFKADRRGRLSDPGPIKRRGGRPSANGTTILSAVVDRPVRTSKKRRLSPAAAAAIPTRSASRAVMRKFSSGRLGRRVTLGEPVVSDATPDYEQEKEREAGGEEMSISAGVAKRRRVVVPVATTSTIIRTRRQQQKEESASASVAASRRRRVSTSTPKRVVLNGVAHMDDEYQPEQDEEGDGYEDEEEKKPIKIRQLPRRSLPARLPRRFHPRRRRPSASPSKPRAATASPLKPHASTRTGAKRGPRPARMGAVVAKANRGRTRRRPYAPSNVKLVFDGIDVPPVDVAWKKKTNGETAVVIGYDDEDADGEIDEEVHPSSATPLVNDKDDMGGDGGLVDMPKEQEEEASVMTEEQEEAKEPTEAVEPEEGGEAEEKAEAESREATEQGEAEEQEAAEMIEGQVEAQPEEQVETGDVAEEQEVEQYQQPEDEDQAMEQGENELGGGGGLIPDDTSSLGNSNKENEAPVEETTESAIDDDDAAAAEMAAQTTLFGAPIAVTTRIVTSARVEYIGGEDDGAEGMEDVQGMEGIEGMEDIDDIDDDMQGPTVEDINSFIA